MNLSKDKVTEIFYFADNFCKEFHKSIEAHAIEEAGKAIREPRRKPKMFCLGECTGISYVDSTPLLRHATAGSPAEWHAKKNFVSSKKGSNFAPTKP